MEDDDFNYSLFITTGFYLQSYFKEKRHLKMIPVYLQSKWNFTLISIFLNEMRDFIKKDHFIEELVNDKISFNFEAAYNSSYQISVIISKNFTKDITVEVSEDWLFNDQEWICYKSNFDSNIGSRNRLINSYRNQTHIRFYKTIDVISTSSKSFITHDNISFLSKSEFSVIFYSFSQNITKFGLPKTEDTEMLLQFIDIFRKTQKAIVFNSFDDLSSQGINGYFNLVLEQILFNKKLQIFTVGDINYYINSGVFILNKAFSLFHNNLNLTIDGFILDTTWRAIPNYVTSILNVCFKNSSLPIAFAFGSGETIYLYDLLLQTVQDHLNIEFEGKYLESDEGSALHSICDKYSMIQLSCLRHFLEKLKKIRLFLRS